MEIRLTTRPETKEEITEEEKKKVMDIVEKHIGTVFSDNTIGKIQTKPIHLDVRRLCTRTATIPKDPHKLSGTGQ